MINSFTDLCSTLNGKLSGDSFFDENFFKEDLEEEQRLRGELFRTKSSYVQIEDFSNEDSLSFEHPDDRLDRVEGESSDDPITFEPEKIPKRENIYFLEDYRPAPTPIFPKEFESSSMFERFENLPKVISSRRAASISVGRDFGTHKIRKVHPKVREENEAKNWTSIINGQTASRKPRLKKNKRARLSSLLPLEDLQENLNIGEYIFT